MENIVYYYDEAKEEISSPDLVKTKFEEYQTILTQYSLGITTKKHISLR